MKTKAALASLVLYFGFVLSAIAQEPASQLDVSSPIENSHKVYTGKIAGKYEFSMELSRSAKQLIGNYKYAGRTKSLILKGTVDSLGVFTMNEFDENGQITGIFSGIIAGENISGEWRTRSGTKKMSFEARESAAENVAASKALTKRQVLQGAIGTYTLVGITGVAGANGMFDIDKTTDSWKCSFSAISNGMRELQQIALSSNEIHLLNSMQIEIDSALAVRFYANGKPLLEVPFKEAGMQYSNSMGQLYTSGLDSTIRNYSASTTFIDKRLYLAAIDGVDYSSTITFDDVGFTSKGIVILSYSLDGKYFELTIMNSPYSDSNTLTFYKKLL